MPPAEVLPWCQAVLGASPALSELLVCRHDTTSVSPGPVPERLLEPAPAGRVSGNTGYRLWIFPLPHVCCYGSTFQTDERILGSQGWKTLLRSCSSVVFKLCFLVFQLRDKGRLGRPQVPALLQPPLSAGNHSSAGIKRVRGAGGAPGWLSGSAV